MNKRQSRFTSANERRRRRKSEFHAMGLSHSLVFFLSSSPYLIPSSANGISQPGRRGDRASKVFICANVTAARFYFLSLLRCTHLSSALSLSFSFHSIGREGKGEKERRINPLQVRSEKTNFYLLSRRRSAYGSIFSALPLFMCVLFFGDDFYIHR